MVRPALVGLALLTLTLAPRAASATDWWHDPDRGCGLLDGWQRTGRIKELPGCDLELPKGAPPGELAMHDAKKALHEAEKLLDAGQTTDVEAKLELATNIMNKAPNDLRVNWARPHYAKALGILQARLAVVPRLPRLRVLYKAAMDANDLAGKQKTDASKKAAMAASDACVQAFRDAENQGIDLAVPAELTAGKTRPLREDQQDCAGGKSDGAAAAAKPDDGKAATPVSTPDAPGDKPAPAKAGGSDGGVPRTKWAKTLHGDRKKVFLDHDDAFPEYDGDPGPKGAAKASEWHYGSETFQFKRNKLVKPKK